MGNIYIALGANLSNPKETFLSALDEMEARHIRILKLSGLWQSPSWPPGQGYPDYLNGAAQIAFNGAPEDLLDILMEIESKLGRERSQKNAPRTLDLDIIDFAGETRQSERLNLPHPRMYDRGFVLFPLQQIAPDWHDPVSGKALVHFIARLKYADVAAMKYMGTIR